MLGPGRLCARARGAVCQGQGGCVLGPGEHSRAGGLGALTHLTNISTLNCSLVLQHTVHCKTNIKIQVKAILT